MTSKTFYNIFAKLNQNATNHFNFHKLLVGELTSQITGGGGGPKCHNMVHCSNHYSLVSVFEAGKYLTFEVFFLSYFLWESFPEHYQCSRFVPYLRRWRTLQMCCPTGTATFEQSLSSSRHTVWGVVLKDELFQLCLTAGNMNQ